MVMSMSWGISSVPRRLVSSRLLQPVYGGAKQGGVDHDDVNRLRAQQVGNCPLAVKAGMKAQSRSRSIMRRGMPPAK